MSRAPKGPADAPRESDEGLMLATAKGDQRAFAALYDRMAPAVYGLALRVLRDPSLAEEVTQEVLLTVWSAASGFHPARGSARAWVMTIAHRRAVDRVRAEQSVRTRNRRLAATTVERPFDQVAEEVATRHSRLTAQRQVRTALGRLSPAQQTSVEMAYFGGHTYREVAEALQVPLGTVKTRIRDGLRRLASEVG
jgi:RNA polymerase sigma-70 factor (ECF subfamily)